MGGESKAGPEGRPEWTRMEKPCRNGHLFFRNLHGSCVECNRNSINRYHASDKGKAAAINGRPGQKRWRQSERGRERNHISDIATYGITPDDYDMMLADQRGMCAICAIDSPGGRGRWHIDHCHASKKVRGLLCHNCNLGIGNLKDNPSFMRSAAAYIERHQGANA